MHNYFKVSCIIVFSFLYGCASFKTGESWKMLPKDKTIGLTLLWELPEEKLKQILPSNQSPKIRNGKGVLMLFLASTQAYNIGNKQYGKLGIAHLIIPLQNSISIPETIGLKKEAIITDLKRIGFHVRYGEVKLRLEDIGTKVKVEGEIQFEKGSLGFSGITDNIKEKIVSVPRTTLVGKNEESNILAGPEFYNPITFKSITVNQSGENWLKQLSIKTPPDRIWVNVDFGIDFNYYKSKQEN